ncbi:MULTISPECIES: hypothetical protein [unclassified Microbacterium]|nr:MULTISPECIES: hypothetical protein [unclassified Microbacterium]
MKSHLAHVFSTLGVTSRTAAVSSARALGIPPTLPVRPAGDDVRWAS